MTIDRSRIGRNNKARSKAAEREVAKRIGGRRHLADTGGPEDVEHPWLACQVKSGLNVCNNSIREGMASAKLAALGKNKLPCVVLVDRKPTRLGYYIVFELDPFADWNGLVKGELE